MKTPFTFGKIAVEKDFTNREKETERLFQNFTSSTNTILISPRRWGKSSLVNKVSKLVKEKNNKIRFCFIDLNSIRGEEQFYEILATEVLKTSSVKIENIIDNAKKFLGRVIPSITISPSPETDFRLSLQWSDIKKNPGDILDLAEKIAKASKIDIVLCIDEFQNISEFKNPLAFQKLLRAHWQKHQKVSYCLYGSKRHMLTDVFTSPSMPFYKFGNIVFLEKIVEADWITFIYDRFIETGKNINTENAKLITDLTDCHSYYVQQLAQQAWLRTRKTCSKEIISEAFEDLVLQLSMLFQTITDDLSLSQINFLHALINKVEQLSSKRTILNYQLGTSANVVKIKRALINREIIDINKGQVIFLDPLYKYWLNKHFFKAL